MFPVLPIKRTGISRSCGTTKIIEKQKWDVKAFFHFLKHPGVRIRKTRKKAQKKLTPEDVSKVSIVSSCQSDIVEDTDENVDEVNIERIGAVDC